ncbi:MAG: hypothetical protein SGPRY_008448 [Prymnesium sp.]
MIEMSDFTVKRIMAFYGVSKLGKRHLAELIAGLQAHRGSSPLLRLFSEAISLLPSPLPSEGFSFLLSTLHHTATLLDKQPAVSRVRRDAFFHRLGEYRPLYLPLPLLSSALSSALTTQPDALAHLKLTSRATGSAKLNIHPTREACLASSAGQRAIVLGPPPSSFSGSDGSSGYIRLDDVLVRLADGFGGYARGLRRAVGSLYRKFDVDADGVFSFGELTAMVGELVPGTSETALKPLWKAYAHGSAGVTPAAFEKILYEHELREKRTLQAEGGEGAGAEMGGAQEGGDELATLAALWDTVKDTAQLEGCSWYLENWSCCVKLQAMARGFLARSAVATRLG